jgi:hypothetical protein
MILDKQGILYALQNSWGSEKLFLSVFPDGIRLFAPQLRIAFEETIQRETIPRIIEYDSLENQLYIVKIGEKDDENGKLLIVNAETRALEKVIETGLTPTDLVFDNDYIYVSNFDSNTLTVVNKKTGASRSQKTDKKPLKMVIKDGDLWIINHTANSLQCLSGTPKKYKIPFKGFPNNLTTANNRLIITSHRSDAMGILAFDPEEGHFMHLHERVYPYGETTFDTNNSSFYTRGQFGDCLFDITKIRMDDQNRLWITDFLGGKLYIINHD